MKKNILLVDDDETFNFLAKHILASMGCAREIQVVLNGKEALHIVEKCQQANAFFPEVILLDINMPMMNGFQFLQKFHELEFEHKDKILIVMVTSSSDPKDIQTAEGLGVRHYIGKPISEEDIRQVLEVEFG